MTERAPLFTRWLPRYLWLMALLSLALMAAALGRRKRIAHVDGHAAVCYRVYGGICLASGDPLGERRHWERAAQAFVEHAT